MIAKISHGSSLYGVLAYNQLKVDERHADVLFTSRIIEPQGDAPYTIGHLSRSFGDYLTANRKTEKPVLHISLNPDPKDCLSEERFVSLAEEYMRRMGFGDQPYIVYRHNDIGREHLHIVSVRVDETGRAISDSYEHGRSMKVCRELERQFGLVPATPKQWKEGLPLSPVGYGDGNLKGQLAGVIRPLAREWRFRTLGEYRAVLSLYGITVDEVKGEYGGREYHGLTYSATDREGNKVGKPFKSSVFGKEAGVAALERRMHNAAAWEKTHKEVAAATAGKVSAAMQTAGHDRAQFERELMRQGIGVVFRQNEAGRIYGATFIDHAAKAVFNGSRLGKELRVQRPFRRAGRYSLATTLRRSGTSHPAAGAYGRIPMGRTRYRLSSRPQGRHHPERGGRLQPLCPRTRRSVRRPARTSATQKEKEAQVRQATIINLKFNELCKTKTICVDSPKSWSSCVR